LCNAKTAFDVLFGQALLMLNANLVLQPLTIFQWHWMPTYCNLLVLFLISLCLQHFTTSQTEMRKGGVFLLAVIACFNHDIQQFGASFSLQVFGS
jgi:hypothetical protein